MSTAPTSRRRFLALAGALLAAPFAARAVTGGTVSAKGGDVPVLLRCESVLPRRTIQSIRADRLKEINASRRVGYISIGVEDEAGRRLFDPGDWTVYVNGKLRHDLHIQRCNDTEGWFEHLVRDTSDSDPMLWRTYTVHVKANVRLVYRGTNPLYTPFKAQPQTISA